MDIIRGVRAIRRLAVPFKTAGWWLVLWMLIGQVSAQELRGRVFTTDEKGDTVAVQMARLQWLHATVGTYTNIRGNYKLPFANTDTLVISYFLYSSDTVIVKKGERQRDFFINMTQSLQEVVVSKKRKPRYSRKGNPAVELLEKVIDHKYENRIESVGAYKSKIYKKMVMSYGRFHMNFQKNSFNRQLSFLAKYVDTIRTDTMPVLTYSLRESLTDHYYQKSPRKNVNYVVARRMQGLDESLDDEGLGTNLEAMFTDVNIFDNDIELMLNKFVSPLSSSLATTYYHYYITDTVTVDSVSCIELTFSPVNSRNFGFTGRLYVVNDSTYALKKYAINVPILINMNFVRQLIVEQDFMKIDSGCWAPKSAQTLASFSLVKRKKQRQIYIRQNTVWYQYEMGTTIPDSLSSAGQETEAANVRYRNWQWKKMGPEPLTAQESVLDSISTELRRLPFFKALEKTAEILASGYISTTKERKNSLFDIGPVYNMISRNPIEGLRFRVGGMTTAKMNDRWFLTEYVAFGCKDLRIKYNATLIHSFVKKSRHFNEFPRNALSLSTSYDLEMLGQSFTYMDRDNFLMSYTVDTLAAAAQYVRRGQLRYVCEWPSRFSVDTWLQYDHCEAAGAMNYFRINADGTTTRMVDFHNWEWGLKLRWAPGERIYNNQTGKDNLLKLSKNAPVLQITHTSGLLDGRTWYHRTELSMEKRFWLSAFGHIDAKIQGGIVWNRVPFTKLFTPPSNRSMFLAPNTFCLMRPMEFIMDKYVSLYATYHLKGWIFNRIPLWNRLKLREVLSFSGVYGGLAPRNIPDASTPGLYVLPDGCSPIGRLPYMEITAGVENILTVLRIDYVRRLTYARDLKKWGKNGIRVSLNISF